MYVLSATSTSNRKNQHPSDKYLILEHPHLISKLQTIWGPVKLDHLHITSGTQETNRPRITVTTCTYVWVCVVCVCVCGCVCVVCMWGEGTHVYDQQVYKCTCTLSCTCYDNINSKSFRFGTVDGFWVVTDIWSKSCYIVYAWSFSF